MMLLPVGNLYTCFLLRRDPPWHAERGGTSIIAPEVFLKPGQTRQRELSNREDLGPRRF